MRFNWPWRNQPVGVLMVCRANVCRSPMAEALLQHRLREAGIGGRVKVGSAGTHVSPRPLPRDRRAVQALAEKGIRMKQRSARKIRATDFERQEFILAMDRSILATLLKTCPQSDKYKVHLITEFSVSHHRLDVPDPYYGSITGFEEVLELLDDSIDGLLKILLSGH